MLNFRLVWADNPDLKAHRLKAAIDIRSLIEIEGDIVAQMSKYFHNIKNKRKITTNIKHKHTNYWQHINNKWNPNSTETVKQNNIFGRTRYTHKTNYNNKLIKTLLHSRTHSKYDSSTVPGTNSMPSHKTIIYRQRHGNGRGTHRNPDPRMESKLLEEVVRNALLPTRQDSSTQEQPDVASGDPVLLEAESGLRHINGTVIRPEHKHSPKQVNIISHVYILKNTIGIKVTVIQT